MWTKLSEREFPFFREGVLFKFKTNHTAGDGYHFALGVRIDNAEDLSFIGLDGRTWGYGRCVLPEGARHGGKRYTLSVDWIRENFIAICKPIDHDDIWFCEDFEGAMSTIEDHPQIADWAPRKVAGSSEVIPAPSDAEFMAAFDCDCSSEEASIKKSIFGDVYHKRHIRFRDQQGTRIHVSIDEFFDELAINVHKDGDTLLRYEESFLTRVSIEGREQVVFELEIGGYESEVILTVWPKFSVQIGSLLD